MNEHPLVAKISNAIESLSQLRIVTSVGAGTWDSATQKYTAGADAKVAYSALNLLTGDIQTHIDPSFATGDLTALRDFHFEREREGAAIVAANIAALKELLLLARELSRPTP